MAIEIKPFTEEMLLFAGQLLAQRHRRDREKFPMLPTRFEEEQVAEGEIRATWQA